MVIETPPRVGPGTRWLAGLAVAGLPVVAVLGTYAWWQDRLPDPMPSHWGSGGRMDDTTALAGLVTTFTTIGAAGALVASAGVLLTGQRLRLRRWLVAAGAGTGGFAAGTWLMLAAVALDHAEASQAPAPTWHITALPVAIFALAGLAFAACPPPPPHPAATGRPAPDAPRLDLADGQRAAYSETSYPGRTVYLLVALILVIAVGLSVWAANPWAGAPLLLAVAVALLGATTRVVVDARGLRIGFGPWGWPRVTVPLREITAAHETTARPREWGGWGYRIRTDGSRGLILRAGPAVRLDLSGDRRFVASARDARSAAALVNTLLDRER